MTRVGWNRRIVVDATRLPQADGIFYAEQLVAARMEEVRRRSAGTLPPSARALPRQLTAVTVLPSTGKRWREGSSSEVRLPAKGASAVRNCRYVSRRIEV